MPAVKFLTFDGAEYPVIHRVNLVFLVLIQIGKQRLPIVDFHNVCLVYPDIPLILPIHPRHPCLYGMLIFLCNQLFRDGNVQQRRVLRGGYLPHAVIQFLIPPNPSVKCLPFHHDTVIACIVGSVKDTDFGKLPDCPFCLVCPHLQVCLYRLHADRFFLHRITAYFLYQPVNGIIRPDCLIRMEFPWGLPVFSPFFVFQIL